MAHWSVKKRVDGGEVVFELCSSLPEGGLEQPRAELGRVPKHRRKVTEGDRHRFWSGALDVLYGRVGEIGFERAQRLCVRLAHEVSIPPEPLRRGGGQWSQIRLPSPAAIPRRPPGQRPPLDLPPPLPRTRGVSPPASDAPTPDEQRHVFEYAMRSAIASAGKARADEK